jgi:hypothetical protein
MFYSGDTIDAETRSAEDLLAKLAAASAGADVTQSEGDKNRAAEAALADKNLSAQKRAQLLSVLGTGAGAATTLGGLALMKDKGMNNVINLGNGQYGLYDPVNKTINPIKVGGVGGPALTPETLSGTSSLSSVTSPINYRANVGGLSPMTDSARANAGVLDPNAGDFNFATSGTGVGQIETPSIWSKATSKAVDQNSVGSNLGSLALGAGGGLAGNALAAKIGAGNKLGTKIGSGVGGLGGGVLGYALSGGNPLYVGLGALGGSLGGGLLGNLFR